MIETATLQHDSSSVRTARRFVSHRMTGHEPEVVGDVELMVSELVTNAIKHSQPPCTVALELTSEQIRVEVRDGGPGVPEMRYPSPDQPCGRGLSIVSGLADQWGVDRTHDGNTVWFKLDIRRVSSQGRSMPTVSQTLNTLGLNPKPSVAGESRLVV